MKRKILFDFLKDKMALMIGFFANTLLVALFYRLSTKSPVELLYPLILSFFLFFVLILFEWVRYYRFSLNLQRYGKNASYELHPLSREQKEAARVIDEIHRKYLRECSDIKSTNQERLRFLSQWIHNMKIPVSVMDLILQNPVSGSGMPGLMDSLGEENGKLDKMLDQVLNLLRLEEFAADYVPEPVDLAASVRNVINERKSQFIYSNVYPKFPGGEEIITVLSDRKWNEFMLGQIVSNAIKYSISVQGDKEAGRKCVLFAMEQKNGTTLLTIKDEGIGIPAYDLKRITEPFFTGENGRASSSATGIGLYISSVIAKKLGHDIRIESEVGKGTTVTISYLSKL